MKKLLLLLLMFAGLNVFAQLPENFETLTAPALPAGWATFETGTGAVGGPSWVTSATTPFNLTGTSAFMNRENVSTGLCY